MLDRAWSRRPTTSPAPWGQSVPDTWADTAVTFIRNEDVENTLGSYSEGGDHEYGPVDANVSIDTEVNLRTGNDSMAGSVATGPIRRRLYLVIIDPSKFTPFAGFRPRKGDRMRFLDPRFTEPVTVNIESAVMPNGIGDHWEIESEAFE